MTATALPTQIAAVRQAYDRAPSATLQAVITTLEWLYANEAKIKAKVEQPTKLCSETSGRTYTQHFTGHIDFDRSSWQNRYEIKDDAGALIGFRYVGSSKKKGGDYDILVPYGSQEFTSPKEFIAAYERGAWKPQFAEAA